MAGETLKQCFVIRFVCARLIEHHNIIARQFAPVFSEGLPHDALQPVAAGCVPAVLFGHGETESGPLQFVTSIKHGKQFICAAPGFLEDAAVRFRIQPSVLSRKPLAGWA